MSTPLWTLARPERLQGSGALGRRGNEDGDDRQDGDGAEQAERGALGDLRMRLVLEVVVALRDHHLVVRLQLEVQVETVPGGRVTMRSA